MALYDNPITADPITVSNPNPLYPQQQPQQGMGAGVALNNQARQQVQQQSVDPLQYMKSNLAQGIEVQNQLLNLSQDPRIPVNIDQAQKYANSLGIGLPGEEEMKKNVAEADAAIADADAKTKELFEAQHKAHPGQLAAELGLTAIGLGLPAAVFTRMMQSKNLGTKPQDAHAAQALATSLANKLKNVREGDLHAITGLKEANEMMLQVHDRTIAQNKAWSELGSALSNQASRLVADPNTGRTNDQQANVTSQWQAYNAQQTGDLAKWNREHNKQGVQLEGQTLENKIKQKALDKPEPPTPLGEGTKSQITHFEGLQKTYHHDLAEAVKKYDALIDPDERRLASPAFTDPAKRAALQATIDKNKAAKETEVSDIHKRLDYADSEWQRLSGYKAPSESSTAKSYTQSSSAQSLKESTNPQGEVSNLEKIIMDEKRPLAERQKAAKRRQELQQVINKGK